jgi:putative ABC transport system permease protein|tara:strand:+ start:3873 stop:5105 length:1233 start_codon:yes stop_codon:yes gene_type:complete
VRSVRDLVGVAVAGLTARWSRTLLIMLGPIIGVSAIVAAVGLTESAKGDLQETLAALGDNLIRGEAAASFSADAPIFTEDVVERVNRLATVEGSTATKAVSGIITTPYEAARSYYTAFPTPVLTADEHFLDVMQVELVSGRWLNSFDQDTAARTAVVGIGLADEFGFREGNRTIKLNDLDYGVVGVVERYPLDPVFDNAVIIPASTADADFDVGLEPDTVYVRSDPAFTLETEAALPVAINLGGDIETSTTVLSDALEAEAAADSTLQIIVAAMGLLALIVGGVGIANVMSISVIQRSAEIGIRRALGHGRSLIAWQFLIESVAVGLLGGLAGALVGVGIVVYASRIAGWVFVLSPELDLFGIQLPSHYVGVPTLYLIGVGAALLTSVFAGLYPSVKAARLEPLETLRLG